MEVLSRTQLLTLLGSRDALDRSLGVSWQRVLQGAYVPVEVTIDLAVRARAAARLLPDHAHLSDRCLLWLHGVDVLPPGSPVLEAVVPRGKVVPRRSGMRLREAHLPLEDRTDLGVDAEDTVDDDVDVLVADDDRTHALTREHGDVVERDDVARIDHRDDEGLVIECDGK